MKIKNVVFAGFSALAVTLSPVASSVAPVIAPVYAITQAPSTLATPNGVADVGRILRTFKIKKNVEVTDNGKIII